ncbi:hypothetical protein GCM10010503_00220 [Streptomyces lucensis JCM 4490]|uniref:Uncharacterized protein n=1 Tax=Streptomyces lucensis JCM 4490 TaxID=1306176 RepID=A0A918MJU2_9ACTN|nr:hypothetical protein [Streptomyces lucensis]GGW28755.1 hypothetical protein GCM10010503_00220 [Streptomyces lucensis JCM 4490]
MEVGADIRLDVLSVAACAGWGGYPHAKNVRTSQLVGTWRDRDCDTTLTLHADGSASVTGMPTEMALDHKVKHRLSGDGTWEIGEFGSEQQLEVAVGHVHTSFDLYRNEGRLLVGLIVGDPDDMNRCVMSRHSKTAADAPTAAVERT